MDIVIDLTKKQQRQLLEIMGKLRELDKNGTPGMALAQVFDDHMRVSVI